MSLFAITLVLATLLCALVAGFLFAYAIVIMPGIKGLDDRGFLRAFQITDAVIQNNQPVFVVVWLGSVIALIASAVLGWSVLEGLDFVLMIAAVLAYLLGVQAPTFVVNVPLNNQLQKYDLAAMSEEELSAARQVFEPRWNQSNERRTLIACAVSLALIIITLGQ